MNILRKISIFSACLLSLLIFVIPAYAQNEAVAESDAPIILETAKLLENGQVYVLAKGLVKPNYEVLIYINGTYSGLANISQGNADFSLFNYLSPSVRDANNTEITAIARDLETRHLSSPSLAKVDSIIEKTVISQSTTKETINPTKQVVFAPILETPRQNICEYKPYISGFSKNQTTVKIFIDNKLYTNLPVASNVSEIAFFDYTPIVSLNRGQHFVYAIAEDPKGNLSPKSNLLTFCVSDPQTISTSTPEDPELRSSSSTTIESSDTDLVFQKTKPQAETTATTSSKHKFNVNLLLFGLFILIIIVWIVFVNKELLEDSRDQTTKIE